METGMNTLQRSYKSYNFAPNVSPHYTVKLKPRKTAHFEVNKIVTVYFITQQQEWVDELSELYFLQVSTVLVRKFL